MDCFRLNTYVVLLLDNVTLQIDGVLYLRILDPFKVSTFLLSASISVGFSSHSVLSFSSEGQLWSGGPRICRYPAGTDHHEIRAGETDSGQSV